MKIAFIGLGNMGHPMAKNIIKAGYEVYVYDRKPGLAEELVKLGATESLSLEQTLDNADVVCTSLPGPAEVEEIVTGSGGLLEHMKSGSVFIDFSTNSPILIRELAILCEEKSIAMLDAPVSGGVNGAKSRKLGILVGGPREVFDTYKPLLDAVGEGVIYAGGIGNGTVCKLVHNCMSASFNTVLGEGFALGVKAGVDPETLWRAVCQSSLGRGNGIHVGFPGSVLTGEFTQRPGLAWFFALSLMSKDVTLAMDMARSLDVPMAIGTIAEQELNEGVARGWGSENCFKVVALQEERVGVTIRAQDFEL